MTKAAIAGQLPSSNALHFRGGGGNSKIASTTAMKRKTPSELRGELLKRKNIVELVDESPTTITGSMRNADGAVSGPKQSDSSKAPRYVDTRVDELFPVRKNSIRLRMLSKKEEENLPIDHTGSLKNPPFTKNMEAKLQHKNLCMDNTFASRGGKDCTNQTAMTGKCSNNTFRSVTQLSQGVENLNGMSSVDMDKALKGLVSCKSLTASVPSGKSNDITGGFMPQNFSSEFHVPGQKTPLDLTLKTTMRVLASSSVKWFHRLVNGDSFCGMAQFMHDGCSSGDKMPHTSEATSTCQVKHLESIYSWVHPQFTLPRSAISALTMSASGGQVDFLSKRQQTWEDSFRSLYYMLRKKICDIFYVCTEQFTEMFTGSDGSEDTKCSCFAYISRSTRYLRSLLKEQDVTFSMPLCKSKVEEITAEDLVELSEIEKYDLGETPPLEMLNGVDNSPQSLLMFSGNKNVHGLYDFLLNYRSFLASLTAEDVPVLYSRVPFQNAALSAPEVRCKEVKKADYVSSEIKGTTVDEPNRGSSAGICYSIEIKDAYLPPWVISGVCTAMQSNRNEFEASFITESTSVGLNIGLTVASEQPDRQAKAGNPLQECGDSFGIRNTILSSQIRSAFLKGLKYCKGSYKASISPV